MLTPGLTLLRSAAGLIEQALRRILLALVRGYRFFLSPWLGSACRFEPTCSAYAQQALTLHGAWTGSRLTAWRLLRCHPWCPGGHDPVPPVAPRFLTSLLQGRSGMLPDDRSLKDLR